MTEPSNPLTQEQASFYERIIFDVLDAIAEMRLSGDYDENTLEALEWRLGGVSND